MSTIVPSNFPASKSTAENRYQQRKSSKLGVTQPGRKIAGGPQKSIVTQPTPRKALGEISNNAKTPGNGLMKATVQKPKGIASHPKKKSSIVTQKPMTEEFPDIEFMPAAECIGGDLPFVTPSYFNGISSALKSTGLPPMLGDFSTPDYLSSLTLEARTTAPKTKFDFFPGGFEEFDVSGLDGLAPVDLPDLSDL